MIPATPSTQTKLSGTAFKGTGAEANPACADETGGPRILAVAENQTHNGVRKAAAELVWNAYAKVPFYWSAFV